MKYNIFRMEICVRHCPLHLCLPNASAQNACFIHISVRVCSWSIAAPRSGRGGSQAIADGEHHRVFILLKPGRWGDFRGTSARVPGVAFYCNLFARP